MESVAHLSLPNGKAALNGHADPTVAVADVDAPEQVEDLWGSILNSVKSSKAIVTKNVILLGEPQTGKTTLLSSLAATSLSGFISSSTAPKTQTPLIGANEDGDASGKEKTTQSAADLGLGYGYFDVGDEKDRDEVVARVGVYTLRSSHPSYTSLLPFAFSAPIGSATSEQATSAMLALSGASSAPSLSKVSQLFQPKPSIDAVQDSLILITLDWEQPWTFLEQLRNWLEILRRLIDSASGGALGKKRQVTQQWSRAQVALDEMREKLELYIRSYVEPQPANEGADSKQGVGSSAVLPANVTTISSALENEEQSPLTEGMLTENWGVPIVVTCTKADLITKLERDKDFKEEQFDYIQQVLRTVCMKYGAALFFTSHTRAQSFDILRSYLLHRLFTPSHSANPLATAADAQASGTTTAAGAGGSAGGSTAFPFSYRASTTDRDTLLVPSGWDSWGKIKALRDGFDCKVMGRGWEYDCEIEQLRRERGIQKDDKEAMDQLDREIDRDADGKVPSAVKLYDDIVADWHAGSTSTNQTNRVKQPDEQAFLEQHYANLQKDPDPRSKFAKQATSVVGPMSGFDAALPSVDKIMTEKSEETAAAPAAKTARSAPSRPPTTSRPSGGRKESASTGTPAISVNTGRESERSSSRPTSPAVGASSPGGASSPNAPKQSEVLHSFFQSLLKDKGTPSSSKLGSGGSRSSRSHQQSANGTGTPTRSAADKANSAE